ncbi:uncharacterized protein N7482_002521 [Penicillium canariense]|uniref:Nitrogen regulatory protein areA GATA-like domain-containing protein n=1 Tax=Penicillium canariense TaxID=189055 RepID=A0A9W9LUX0_9EURO|nr:uncharacterized protein N7482_002521 [Penicillium canariense]KAJ5176644.1 hypothetical protein N7482_002521 [Penicillium canariense]
MEQRVPQGLVRLSQISPGGIQGHEKLDTVVTQKLWRVFQASRRASHSQADQRLEYLFWRIWGNQVATNTVTVQRLDRLASRIMAPAEPLRARKLTNWQPFLIRATGLTIHPQTDPIGSAIDPPHDDIVPARSQPANDLKTPLHPILKKPNNAHSEPQKTTRLLLETPGGGSITRNPSNPPTPNMPDLGRKDSTAGKPGSKKTYLTAARTSRGSRRRPVFNRRKSSQSSVLKTSDPSDTRESHPDPAGTLDPMYEDGSALARLNRMPPQNVQSSLDVEAPWTDLDQFELTPIAQPSNPVAPANTSLVSNNLPSSKDPAPDPAVLAMSHKKDPVLPQEIETVSPGLGSQDPYPAPQDAEPQDPSSSETAAHIEGTDVPGFPGAKCIPMPESMITDLVNLLTRPEPLQEQVALRHRPSFISEHMWRRIASQPVLDEWAVAEEHSCAQPQPSDRPVVLSGFRARFAKAVEDSIAEHKSTTPSAGPSPVVEAEPDTWHDSWCEEFH